MPSYRNSNEEYYRKPKPSYEKEYEPEMDDEDDEMEEDRKCKKAICEVECPFKIVVKVIPCDCHKRCDDHKRPMPM